jgi:hypothetical protein
MPRGLRKRITTIDSSGFGIQRAMNGFEVSTVSTHWKLMSVQVKRDMPDYIDVDHTKMTRVPTLSEVPSPVMMEPHLAVEYYSR